MPQAAPRVLVFDSGLGGLTVLRRLSEAVPEAAFTYLADDAFFPYGSQTREALVHRVGEVVGDAISTFKPDVVVIACNTASTIVLPSLRAAHTVPFIGTVPAIKPAVQLSHSQLISVLATPATVRRDYTRDLIATHGQGAAFTLVGSERLAGLVETILNGGTVADAEITAEIAPCFVEVDGGRTDVVVLACTHYPLLKARLTQLAPWPVTWVDPAPAIARRTANILAERGFAVGVGAAQAQAHIIFTSGKKLPLPLVEALKEYGLTLVNGA